MPRFLLSALLLLPVAACVAPGSGPVVSAPALASATPNPRAPPPPHAGSLTACALPWTLQDVEGGAGRVVAVCGSDVRRMDLEPGDMTRGIEAVLEPARARVCACAAKLAPPQSLDLVVTSRPDEGASTAEAGEPDEDQDPELLAAFVACLGTVKASFAPFHAETCGPDRATFKYPLQIDLSK